MSEGRFPAKHPGKLVHTQRHRPAHIKALRAAQVFGGSQESLDHLLSQFSKAHRQGILERLRPHLTFEPRAAGTPETATVDPLPGGDATTGDFGDRRE